MTDSVGRLAGLAVDRLGDFAEGACAALAREVDLVIARAADEALAALGAHPAQIVFVRAEENDAAARDLLAEIARRAPNAIRIAVAPPTERDFFALEAAGAEQIIPNPAHGAMLRLAARQAARTLDLRRAASPGGV